MVTQASAPRPIGQTTITRHAAPVRLHGPMTTAITTSTGQRMINATVSQIRPGTTIVQNNTIQHQLNPPALQPVGATLNQTSYAPGGAQVKFTNLLC